MTCLPQCAYWHKVAGVHAPNCPTTSPAAPTPGTKDARHALGKDELSKAGGVGAPQVAAPPAHISEPLSRRQWALMALWFALPVTFLVAVVVGFVAHP